MKTCSVCNKEKDESEFYPKQGRCKKCNLAHKRQQRLDDPSLAKKQNDRMREYRRKHPKKVRRTATLSMLKLKYNITPEDYEVMLDQQGGVCFVCKRDNKGRNLHVDHCHDTGMIRGLLCHHCNVALGHMQDDPILIRKLADYLETSRRIQ